MEYSSTPGVDGPIPTGCLSRQCNAPPGIAAIACLQGAGSGGTGKAETMAPTGFAPELSSVSWNQLQFLFSPHFSTVNRVHFI
jgi:hypothetical protein